MAFHGGPIMRLPMELLELIAGQVHARDLLSFRLVCRAFADKAFDGFAGHYFSEISCFFPDPARAQRLHNIASQPHLVKHVRDVWLTLDPFEYNDENIDFVEPVRDRGEALPNHKERYRVEELAYYCAQRPDLTLITNSLNNLDPLRCNLHVDIGERRRFCNHVEWAIISQKCLAAVARAVYPIAGLNILSAKDIRNPYPSFSDDQELQNITQLQHRLYCTTFNFIPSGEDVQARALGGNLDGLTSNLELLPSMPNSVDSLDMIFWHRVHSLGSDLTPFANRVLADSASRRLRRLTFARVVLDNFGPLLQLMEQCQDTFESILLHEVEIISEDLCLWRKFFELLATMQTLQHLNIQELWLGRTRSAPLAILDARTRNVWTLKELGHPSVRRALENTLEAPPCFRSRSDNVSTLW